MHSTELLPASFLQHLQLPSAVTQIHHPLISEKQLSLYIKRDELIHPVIQGNKWRKLKYNISDAISNGHKTILSFGGAYSNHLHAMAALARVCKLKSIGIIRGEQPATLNPCLEDMQHWGMQLNFISRQQYRNKSCPDFLKHLKQQYNDAYIIPEGGNNSAGVAGSVELLDEIENSQQNYDFICCEVGSGTTFSALVSHNKFLQTQYLGFLVMKNPEMESEINNQISSLTPKNYALNKNWKLITDYHFGGFAKSNIELNEFIKKFKLEHAIQLEPVYSGKMLYGILDMIKQDYFSPGQSILAIHGGGLQGLRGYPSLHNTNE